MKVVTPGTASTCGRKTKSAISRSSIAVAAAGSAVRAINRISPMIEERDAICGTTPAGSCAWITPRRSLTRTRASVMSVAHSNSAATIAKPIPEVERTVSTPGVPLSKLSIGRVTSALDFLRSQAFRLRHHRDGRPGQVGQRHRPAAGATGNIRRSPASRRRPTRTAGT